MSHHAPSPLSQVVIGANEAPSINDITLRELLPLLAAAGDMDPQVLG